MDEAHIASDQPVGQFPVAAVVSQRQASVSAMGVDRAGSHTRLSTFARTTPFPCCSQASSRGGRLEQSLLPPSLTQAAPELSRSPRLLDIDVDDPLA